MTVSANTFYEAPLEGPYTSSQSELLNAQQRAPATPHSISATIGTRSVLRRTQARALSEAVIGTLVVVQVLVSHIGQAFLAFVFGEVG